MAPPGGPEGLDEAAALAVARPADDAGGASAQADEGAVEAQAEPAPEAATDDAYVDFILDDDGELAAAIEQAVARAEQPDPPLPAPPEHRIPDLPRPPLAPRPFARQLTLLAAIAIVGGAITVAAVHPPPPAAPPPVTLAAAGPAAPSPAASAADPAPRSRTATAASRRATSRVRHAPDLRAEPPPIPAVRAPVEIAAPAPADDADDADAPPAPVSAPQLEPERDQGMRAPPLTGT